MNFKSFEENLMSEVEEGEIVYAKLIINEDTNENHFFERQIDQDEPSIGFSLSLIRSKMLNYELKFLEMVEAGDFVDEDKVFNYRPYFYEFHPFNIDYELLNILEKSAYNGEWLKIRLFTNDISTNDKSYIRENSVVLIGTTVFSASSVRIDRVKLVIDLIDLDNAELDMLSCSYSGSRLNGIISKKAYKKSIEKKFIDIIPSKVTSGMVRVYNVGQGNHIEIRVNGKIFLFDIGMTDNDTDLLSRNVSWNCEKIMPYHRPDAIILSHWDTDHILGIGYLDSAHIYSRTIWIAPDLTVLSKVSMSASRLCLYLIFKSKLFLVKDYNNCLYSSADNNFRVWQGKGTATVRGGNKANNIGLILELQNLKNSLLYEVYNNRVKCGASSILLTGDCDYEKMPDEIQKKLKNYDILMAPHHGANTTIPKHCVNVKSKSKYALISYGINRHGHPGRDHIDELEKMYFVKETKNINSYTIAFR